MPRSEPYEAMHLRRRYLWAAACRESDQAFWPGRYSAEHVRLSGGYRPRAHAAQQWWAGQRFYRLDHWKMAAFATHQPGGPE